MIARMRSKVDHEIIESLLPLLTQIYNIGYINGHEDTVEGCYTDIVPSDFDSFQSDIVKDVILDILNLREGV